jgi:Tol biopolymer transport system component
MRHSAYLAVLSTVVLLVLAGRIAAQSETESDAPKVGDKTAEPKPDNDQPGASLAGSWRADWFSTSPKDGTCKTYGPGDGPLSVTISEKMFTMRVGDKLLADMPYVLDAKRRPWAIDLKSPDGALSGRCRLEDDALEISLDDEAKGRPRDFDKLKNPLVLALRRFPAESLFVIRADGSHLRRILSSADFTTLGSPDWSRDGSKITLDGSRSVMGEGGGLTHILVIHADGSGLKDLGPGAMPCWSPDGKRIAYSEYGPQRGVWIMNADASDRNLVDPGGWGAQWSPTRDEIAYTTYDGGPNICVHDLAKKERRTLLQKSYRQIYWGLNWSPDGDWICFKADLPEGGSEITAVHAQGEKKGFRVIVPSSAAPQVNTANMTLAWGGTGNEILISMQTKTGHHQLHIFDFAGRRPSRLFPGIPASWPFGDVACSPDGKEVVFTAWPPVKPPQPSRTQPAAEE